MSAITGVHIHTSDSGVSCTPSEQTADGNSITPTVAANRGTGKAHTHRAKEATMNTVSKTSVMIYPADAEEYETGIGVEICLDIADDLVPDVELHRDDLPSAIAAARKWHADRHLGCPDMFVVVDENMSFWVSGGPAHRPNTRPARLGLDG